MMKDILGAVASNAGDEFHELWAFRTALSLLDPDSDVTAITLEGVATNSETVSDGREWDGVDCALYFGGGILSSIYTLAILA